MSTKSSIPELLDRVEVTDSNNDLEPREQLIRELIVDIAEAKAKGQINRFVCLFCQTCECFVVATTDHPEPVHHCGAVLEIAICGCCQQPATHWREMSDGRGTDNHSVEAFADGHYYGRKRTLAAAIEILSSSPLTGAR